MVYRALRSKHTLFVGWFGFVLVGFLTWWPLGAGIALTGGVVAVLRIERWSRHSAPVAATSLEQLDELGLTLV
jgi:hypothetical protein